MSAFRSVAVFLIGVFVGNGGSAICAAQMPDHPIITEIFNNPPGNNDGPTGHDPANPHQEFIEIYLPPVSDLSPTLLPFKDSLKLTFYEIKGDSMNAERGWVDQRIDLPTIDLDGGSTAPVVNRPANGVLVIGWVNYSNSLDPPTGLAGTPSTRIGMINSGITTSPSGAVFIAMNGAEFTGTTNFPVPTAESLIEYLAGENMSGVMENGSNAYLLVRRDAPGYVSLIDRSVGTVATSNASLNTGSVLGVTCLLDGIAGNDDSNFTTSLQPYSSPTGLNIDLEDILPAGSPYSLKVCQLAEGSGSGYARRFIDQRRTTEDGNSANDNPATDADTVYRQVFNEGPFFPTPGTVVTSTSPPQFSAAQSTRHMFDVLANTTGRPGLVCANVGGNYGINVVAVAGASSNPAAATFGSALSAASVLGQSNAYPQISVTVPASAVDGAVATSSINFTASNAQGGDPSVLNPTANSVATATVLNPTFGLDSFGSPLETTVFLAVEGLGADVLVTNEFTGNSLSGFVSANQNGAALGALGHESVLLNPSTNLENLATVDALRISFPANEASFINESSGGGPFDLVGTLLNSAKVVSGSSAYDATVNATQTGIKALDIPIPETFTKGGMYTASEMLFFADAKGDPSSLRSGLSYVTTSRTFELAIVDTNMTSIGIESGDDDDFGLVVQVGRVRSGASVAQGQLVFLSFSGGLQGEDVDTVDVPGVNATNLILLDLDNLDDILGCETITGLYVVDADINGTLNVIEVFSLYATTTCVINGDCNDNNDCTADTCSAGLCVHAAAVGVCNDNNPCTVNDHCSGGVCIGGGATNCSDNDACTTDACQPATGCTHFAVSCDDSNVCTNDSCVPATGCTHVNNSSSCEDGNVCTTVDICVGGNCIGGPPPDCDDGQACTLDSCQNGVGCVHDPGQCDDGNECTINDVCDGMGDCSGTPIVRLYGDVAPLPNGNGLVNLDDILCVLTGFTNSSLCPAADLSPCVGNGTINLDDILAVLSAFSGNYGCPHPCPP